jgi:RNA polymerase sigma factor (TIGR02999 family)
MPAPGEVTALLRELQAGDRSAFDRLAPLLYDEMRRLAASLFRSERSGHTLQPTAVVHEAWLRLAQQEALPFETRSHFLGIAARVMRQVLVDASRARLAEKRGGGGVKVELNEELHGGIARADLEVMALHRALDELAALDERKARIVEMRYFAGLTGEEIAEVLSIGTATVTRDLRTAEAWLARALQ